MPFNRYRVAVAAALVALSPAAAAQERLVQVFTLREHYGVAHPSQLIEFEPAQKVDPASTYMIGPDGSEVACQVLRNGHVAVRTDLPAGAARAWKLMGGRAAAAPPVAGAVKVVEGERFYEVTNDLTGFRVPRAAANPSKPPAPIAGVRLRDGKWSAAGGALSAPPVKKLDVRVLERGPLKVVVEVEYRVDRPELRYGEAVLLPAGEGYYRCTIELQAGQPSVLVEEESDCDVSYSIDLHDAVRPTQARYRGHHARDAKFGREPDGRVYRQWTERPVMDATVDLSYERAMVSSYVSDATSWRRAAVWDPWVYDSGWYWQIYDAGATPDTNVAGVFAGRPSRALGAANSGVGIFTSPPDGGRAQRAAGFTVAINRRAPDARVSPRVRFQWGLFVGTKAADLKPPEQVQSINLQMNLHAGVSLNKVHRVATEYPDPPRGYGSLYMERSALDRVVKRLRDDKEGSHGKGYYGYLYTEDPYSRDLIGMWADPGEERVRKAAAKVLEGSRHLLDTLVNGGGIYDPTFHYWHGGLHMGGDGIWIDALLADPRTTPDERAKLKAVAALYAAVLWDDDFVPLFEGHGLNLGTPNMPVQQQAYRDFYALFLSQHPMMKGRVEGVERRTLETVRSIVNEHGAEMGSAHYAGASFTPTLNTLLQLRMLGKDHFAGEPRLARFAEFYMNLLTPPEVRFGGKTRKLVAIGDGSTEGTEMFGPLATGFGGSNPELAARLTGAWHASGRLQSSFFGSTILKINDAAPAKDPALGSANFTGWCSVLRCGWGTPDETAVWFVNGDFYRDHRHADHGSLVIYALGGPLSLDWGSMYSPQTPGGFMHSTVQPADRVRHTWDRDAPPLDAGPYGTWVESVQEGFATSEGASISRARFAAPGGLVWRRTVCLVHHDPARPIIAVRDDFTGSGADADKVFTLNLAAAGDVETPAGRQSPPQRTYDHDKGHKELPSAGPVFPLAGPVERLRFTGQWAIDWDLYVLPDRPTQGLVGNWGHRWHPSREQAEFRDANNREFEERQHVLRLKSAGGFQTLILPHRKGSGREGVTVKREAGRTTITEGDAVTTIGDDSVGYSNAGKQALLKLDPRR